MDVEGLSLEFPVVTATGELDERIHAFPRRRTYLLPALHEVQAACGWLPGEVLEQVGVHLRVPKSETARATGRILADLPVVDLTVEDPPIEDVIERVFASGPAEAPVETPA